MKNIIVTTSWDDGHVLDMRLAELLKKYGIKGTFYISPNNNEIPLNARLTSAQILELSKDFEIGAHTMSHRPLTSLSDAEALNEIKESKHFLEKLLGKPVTTFCYPSGFFSKKHEAMVANVSFTLARTVQLYVTEIGSNPFELHTTSHAYRHWSHLFPILRMVGFKKFLNCYLNWDALAIEMFDKAFTKGSVFHLWGHSWEIDRNSDWERLERVLQHIAHKRGVAYLTNGELV